MPFGALMSLYKSWLTAKAAGAEPARVTLFWILVSQMAGGVLTILIIPLLHLVAPTGPWVTIAAVLLFGFGLLMPLAFAGGVWKFGVLELDPESPPSSKESRDHPPRYRSHRTYSGEVLREIYVPRTTVMLRNSTGP